MSRKTRVVISAGLSVVLGVLVGLGIGAFVWGDRGGPQTSPPANTSRTAAAPVPRLDRKVDAGTYLWMVQAAQSQWRVDGNDVEMLLHNVRPMVVGYTGRPRPQIVSIPASQFFGTNAARSYDFSAGDTTAAVVTRVGKTGAASFSATVTGALWQNAGSQLILKLRVADVQTGVSLAGQNAGEPNVAVLLAGGAVGARP